MRILSFIRQRSFARYVAVDLADAARRLDWQVQWLDLEGLLYEHANETPEGKYRVVSKALIDIGLFDPQLVFSYGLEYLEPVFASYLPEVNARFHTLLKRPAVYFLCDVGFPFDRAPKGPTLDYLVALQDWRSLVFCWDRQATAAVKRAGVSSAFYLPMAANDRVSTPPPIAGRPICRWCLPAARRRSESGWRRLPTRG